MARSTGSKSTKSTTSLEQRLAGIRALDISAPAARDEIRTALRSSTGILIAAAAKRIADDALEGFIDELCDTFERLCGEQAVKRDPGCRGKIAIARALHALNVWEERVFVAGLRIVQREGMLSQLTGKQDDTAGELRGVCGLAHAHFARTDALDVLAELLLDDERIARIAAAQALGDSGRRDASAVLRFKLRVGDADPEVISACIEALLALARDSAVPFVIGLLAEHDETGEAAALALGGARITTALSPLRDWCMGASPEQRRRVGYLALALLRDNDANRYLLDLVRTAARADAAAAARALATFKETLADEIRAAAHAHKDGALKRDVDAMLD